MLELERQETFYKESGMAEPWRAINNLCRENLKGEYKLIFYNIKDCNKYPDPLKFVALDWENLKVLVYREPILKIYSYDNYTDAVNSIKGNEQKFLSEGLTIEKEETYKSLDLLKAIEERPKFKELVKGDVIIKPGNFLNTCWGYDQTNIELFVIKRIIGKNYLIIQEVAKSINSEKGGVTADYVKVAPTIKKVDLPIKAFISNEGSMSVCEYGYKRSLSLTDLNTEHYETPLGMGH